MNKFGLLLDIVDLEYLIVCKRHMFEIVEQTDVKNSGKIWKENPIVISKIW